MALQYIKKNCPFKGGIYLINLIPLKDFKQILDHIYASKDPEIFTPNDIEDLTKSLELAKQRVEMLLLTIQFIWGHIQYVLLDPTEFRRELTMVLDLSDEKAEAFMDLCMRKLRDDYNWSRMGVLRGINWQMTYPSQRGGGEMNARVQFIHESEKRLLEYSQKLRNFCIDCDQRKLEEFHNQLEDVQKKLDEL